MAEDKIEAFESILGEHGEVFVPIGMRVVPFAFQVLVMQEVANAAHCDAWRFFRITEAAVPTNSFSGLEETIHQTPVDRSQYDLISGDLEAFGRRDAEARSKAEC